MMKKELKNWMYKMGKEVQCKKIVKHVTTMRFDKLFNIYDHIALYCGTGVK